MQQSVWCSSHVTLPAVLDNRRGRTRGLGTREMHEPTRLVAVHRIPNKGVGSPVHYMIWVGVRSKQEQRQIVEVHAATWTVASVECVAQ